MTGGTLGRSAGGYSTGAGRVGGARYFSHTPAAPAEVISNVSQAVRAFWLSGQKAQFDGMSSRNEKRFKTITALQQQTGRRMRSAPATAPGSYVDFRVTPTITAVGPLSSIPLATSTHEEESLHNDIVMNTLSVDFARALKDLAIIMNDLQKLSTLGDLSMCLPNSSTLRVRFPGCDADTVHKLCVELGICRGLIYQDDDFDFSNGTEMALLFPFAPSPRSSLCASPHIAAIDSGRKNEPLEWQNMLSPKSRSSRKYSTRSTSSHDFEEVEAVEENPWQSSPSGYTSLEGSDEGDACAYMSHADHSNAISSSEYEGLEGIYRFLEECDRARR